MLAIYNMMKGHNYYCKNYGDEYEFVVVEINSNTDVVCKDLNTLDIFNIQDVFITGKGPDYELKEI